MFRRTVLILLGAWAVLGGASVATADLASQQIVTGLSEPLFLSQPAGDDRLFVMQRAGQLRVIDGGVLQVANYLSISGDITQVGEGGLLGLAFAPDFATSGVMYVNYTTPSGAAGGMDTVIQRITVADPGGSTSGSLTRETILRFGQPFNNHNSGWIGFAPGDTAGQYLVIPTGDGGSGNDPGNRAQTLDNFFGKVLRLDVSGGDDFPADSNRNYAVPPDNFFAADGNNATLGEIMAFGVRNPYRNSFDRDSGDLYLGDVGQSLREEVSVMPAGVQGQNFGWRIREGDIDNPGTSGTLDPEDRVDPIFDYARSDAGDGTPVLGATIIGGYVYRGQLLGPAYEGLYFFGDFITGRFFTIDPEATNIDASLVEITTELFPGGFGQFDLGSFAEDAAGELYILDRDGQVHRIIPEPATALPAVIGVVLLRRRRR
jgi:glucose/arabinose dehydrogenase